MNWCNKLTGNTCKLIKRIMSTLPTAAQRLYKKLNTKFYFLYYFIRNLIEQKKVFIFYLILVVPKGEVGQGEAIPPFRHQPRRQFDDLTVGHILPQSLPSDYN